MRAITSVPPPGGNGQIILIGRLGQLCASAMVGRMAVAMMAIRRLRTNVGISHLLTSDPAPPSS
jgi:hypothetical protein